MILHAQQRPWCAADQQLEQESRRNGGGVQLEAGQSGQRPVAWIITEGLHRGMQRSDHGGTRVVTVDGIQA